MSWRLVGLLAVCVLGITCGCDDSETAAPDATGGGPVDYGGDGGTGGARENAGGASEVAAGGGGDSSGGVAGATHDLDPDEYVPELPEVDETHLAEPVARAGFIELEPTTYSAPFEVPPERQSERSRLFYSFRPADQEAKSKPIFVFFNGGPGTTSMILLSLGTGPYTLDADNLYAPPEPNPYSFTSLGNVLYIDSRHAGFSYGLSEQPELELQRAREFSPESFNAAVDGADFVRVLLRVLEQVPAIANNPVVIVGESYGGTRAAVMLDLLLDPDPDGGPYVEQALAEELDAHYQSIFPGVAPERLTRAARARQFGWQVLLQPLVAGSLQYTANAAARPAALERMAEAMGVSEAELANRCDYDVSRPSAWCDELAGAVQAAVTSAATFELLLGVAPELVPGLPAAQRPGAFRFIADSGHMPDASAWVSRLGAVPGWDHYFNIDIAEHTGNGFSRALSTEWYVAPFLRAARHVNTMITNARLDAVIHSEAIVPALNAVVPLFKDPKKAWFTGAEYVDSEADPPTRIRLSYAAEDDLGPAAERIIYMPTFERSGHFVSAAEPAQFLSEVRAFLAETGLDPAL